MIMIIDFGSQYTQLIARRLRELGFYTEVYPYTVDIKKLQEQEKPISGFVLSGGPESVDDPNAPSMPSGLLESGKPVLGICYGMQLMAKTLGGIVAKSYVSEFGAATIGRVFDCPLISALEVTEGEKIPVWMSHGDHVTGLPLGFVISAVTQDCPIAAFVHPDKHFYGVQFHPEVTHTRRGDILLEVFADRVCCAPRDWTKNRMLASIEDYIHKTVGPNDHVLLGLSGGVDSAVAAVILGRVLKERLLCVFVDNGLLRHQEAELVMGLFKSQFHLNIVHVDAHALFLDGLKGVCDPEAKRKVIGKIFVEVFEKEASKYPNISFLAQGTIYPDVIESAHDSKSSHNIKSHHNVGGLPKTMRLKLVEPLRTLFKDEVRALGDMLNMPAKIIMRHPFPGPGLAVRILGEVTIDALKIVRHADAIFMDILERSGWHHKVSQAFCVFLPVKSVGVVGDARQYEPVLALRAVVTSDFMTAEVAELPYGLLQEISSRILNEVRGVSRVTYDISSKPPATIEWE